MAVAWRLAPEQWRQGYRLYRRRIYQDSFGDSAAAFDLTAPDYQVEDGSPDGICWQPVRSWNLSASSTGAGEELTPQGELPNDALEGRLRSAVAMAVFDRLEIGGRLYEIRGIQRWPSHQRLLVKGLD